MEKHRSKEKTPKTFRLTEVTINQLADLVKEWGGDGTSAVTKAIEMAWKGPEVITAQPSTNIHVDSDNVQPSPADPAESPKRAAYPAKPEVWENIGMKYDRVRGEFVETEKLQRPPWTERPVEGGETDYWPA